MLFIRGREITSGEDDFLTRNIGHSHQRPEYVNEMIDWYIEQEKAYTFTSSNSMIRMIAGLNGSYLVIQQVHPTHSGPYRIVMSGSRTSDYCRANAIAGLSNTPAGYTWHHREGITGTGANIQCNMFLIDTSYHSRVRHKGAVHEYELRTHTSYT